MYDDFLKPISLGCIRFSPDEALVAFSVLGCDAAGQLSGRIWMYDRRSDSLAPLTEPGDCPDFSFWDQNGLLFSEHTEQNGQPGTMVRYYALDRKTREDRFFIPLPGLQVTRLEDDLYLLSGEHILQSPAAGDASAYSRCEIITRTPYRMDAAGDVQGRRSRLWLYRPDWTEPKDFFPEQFHCSASFYQKETGLLYYTGESFDRVSTGVSAWFRLDPRTMQSVYLGTTSEEIGLLTAVGTAIYGLAYDRRGNGALYRFDPHTDAAAPVREHVLQGDVGWCLDTDIALLGGGAFCGHDDRLWMLYSDPSGARICTYENGQIRHVSPEGYQVRSFAISPGGSIFAVCLEGFWPLELFELRGGEWIRRSNFNTALDKDRLQLPVPVPYQNRCGQDMLGWLIPPKDYTVGRSYPGFLIIHEGPQGRYEATYNSDMQFLSSLGYFVFFTNPRGGSCVSREFADLEDRMGTIDYEDLMDFTDAVLQFCPDLDPKRLAVGGISYGGFMTNWIIGHTDRFHTAVSMSSISNWVNMYGTMDMPYCVEYGSVSGKPWTNFEGYWRSSPLASAHRAVTPTLFIQGEEDHRCPLPQAQQMFCILQKNGVRSRLIQYPDASHNFGYFGSAKQRASRYEEIARWLLETNT